MWDAIALIHEHSEHDLLGKPLKHWNYAINCYQESNKKEMKSKAEKVIEATRTEQHQSSSVVLTT